MDESRADTGANLPSEVYIQIFEDIKHTSPRRLPGLRVVSKQIDALVIPIMYRQQVLSERLLECFRTHVRSNDQAQVFHDVCRHTKEITIDRPLDLYSVIRLLESLENLQYLRVCFWEPSTLVEIARTRIFTVFRQRWPNAKLAIEGLEATTDGLQVLEDANVPFSQVVSCRFVDSRVPVDAVTQAMELATNLSVVRVLNACPHLQRLHLVAGRTFHWVHEGNSPNELPPVRELIVENYDWLPDVWQPESLRTPLDWNLTNLTHLELKNTNTNEFLAKVMPPSLPQLRHFATDSVSVDGSNERILEWVTDLCGLETLRIRCSMPNLSFVHAATKHASTLRTLDIREGQGRFAERNPDWPVKCLTQLLSVPELVRRLKHLSIDCSTSSESDSSGTFGTSLAELQSSQRYHHLSSTIAGASNPLTQFRNLQALSVFVRQPYIADFNDNRARSRCVGDEARRWIREQVVSKGGVDFEEVAVRVEVGRYPRHPDKCPWAAHSTYLYEGVKDQEGELVIQEEMHELSQEWIEIHSFGY